MPETEDRLSLLRDHRRCRRTVHRLRKALRCLADKLSMAEERSGDAEAELAADILVNGHLVHDGRRYRVEHIHGIARVQPRPADAALELVGAANCPGATEAF